MPLPKEIVPVYVGKIVGLPKAMITFPFGFNTTHDAISIIFVIKTDDHPIIVDTGPSDPEWAQKYHGYHLIQTEAEKPENALKRVGIDPAYVKIVINTHLHWDHCFHNDLFQNAKFIVQRKELEYALDPLDLHRVAYEKIPGVTPPWIKVFDKIVAVEGKMEIAPGVFVIPLPGHTPGSQGVIVNTSKNKYLLTGDCVDTYENWNGNEKVAHIPSGVHTNLIEYNKSFKLIEKLERDGYEVIPSHDPAVLDRKVLE
jgi:glyoxylase-like metal-dependent hydrolase (beta-lactamase superfamily II)